MVTSVVAFATEHLDAAAGLLARRHTAHRRVEPLLDVEYEGGARCRQDLVELLDAPGASGAVAFEGTVPVAFVLGAPQEPAWGNHTWVPAAGHAALQPEPLRDVYALAAQRWYDEGRTSHYVLSPTHDVEVLGAWYRLGFGQMHAHAIRESAPLTPPVLDAVLRVPTTDDLDQIVELELVLPQHQARSPVFAPDPQDSAAELRADWEQDIDDPTYHHMVIERDGRLLALGTACAASVSRMHRGIAGLPDAGFLGHAAVRDEARGLGYGRALGEAAIGWSYAQGFRGVVNDWRVTNLAASRAWPSLGWHTTFLRLHRTIGPAG